MLKQKAIQSFARQHFNEIKYIEESNGPASFLTQALPGCCLEDAQRMLLYKDVKKKVSRKNLVCNRIHFH
jgi:hypothetical protein